LLLKRVDAGRVDADVDAGLLGILRVEVHGARKLLEPATDVADHHVPNLELDQRVCGVNLPLHACFLLMVDMTRALIVHAASVRFTSATPSNCSLRRSSRSSCASSLRSSQRSFASSPSNWAARCASSYGAATANARQPASVR